jgi:hypothetical protein
MSFCGTCAHNATLHDWRGCTLCACGGFTAPTSLVIGQGAAHGLLRAAQAALNVIERNSLTHALLAAAIRTAEINGKRP